MASRRFFSPLAVAVALTAALVAALVALPLWDFALAVRFGSEDDVLEWVQVVIFAGGVVLAARAAWRLRAAGRPATLEVVLGALLIGLIVGEVDLDKRIFGVKVIATKFIVSAQYPVALRALAVAVIVGVPVALGIYALRRRRQLWRATLDLPRTAWGKPVVLGVAVLVLTEVLERQLGRLPGPPRNYVEEALEVVAALNVFVGLASHPGAMMNTMSRMIVLALAAVALALPGCRGEHPASASQDKPAASPPAPRQVRVVDAVQERVAVTVVATGTLAAEDQVTLSSKVAGRLADISVDMGSRVKKGQVLARLDPSDYKLRVDQSEASLQQARARLGLPPTGTDERIDPERTSIVRQARAVLEEARLTRDRSVKLLEQNLIARAQADSAEANLAVAEGRYHDALEEVRNRQAVLAQRRSELELARQQLSDTSMVSPIDGAVSVKQASPGEYLAAGAPVATLVRIHPLRLRVAVPERDAADVRTGQRVRLTVEGDQTVYQGRVVRLSPIVQEQNRTLVVEAEIPNERGVLKPGAFARAEIVTDGSQPVIRLPTASVVTFAGIEKVLVVRDGKIAEVRVQTGRRAGESVEILSGVKPGEPVVLQPGNLASGQPVAVTR